jgi:hypothetical protein
MPRLKRGMTAARRRQSSSQTSVSVLAARSHPSDSSSLVPPENRGRGECRVPNAPAASCALGELSMHTSIHSGGAGIIRHSPRNGFTAYNALSPVTSSFLPPSSRGSRWLHVPGWAAKTSAGLSISNGCQDHTTSPYALAPFVLRAAIAHELPRPATTLRADAFASTASHRQRS